MISNPLTPSLASTSTLGSYGIPPALYNNNNLGSQLINNKIDKIDKLDKSGVYKLTCHDCDAFYIGQTGRSFKTRYSEHVRARNRINRFDSINLESASAFAIHLHSSNHSASINKPIPIYFERKGLKLDLLDSTEIKLALSSNCNILNTTRTQ